MLHGDFTIFDRWRWIRTRLAGGDLRTLDAGSGSGAFAMLAARGGNAVVGLSFDEANNETARRRADLLGLGGAISFRQGDLRVLDSIQDLGTFDQVLCQETIEHIADDAKLVRDLAALMRPGARLFMTTPYEGHRPIYGEFQLHTWTEDGGHVRYGYSPARLRQLIEAAGLETAEEGFVGGMLSQLFSSLQAWLSIRARLPTRVAWALTFPLRLSYPLDRALTRRAGYPYMSVFVVARKPAAAD